jgi:hypothetical protein
MIQSEPTEAVTPEMIAAGEAAEVAWDRYPTVRPSLAEARYLAMKALDPDFATRTESQSTDAVERVADIIGQSVVTQNEGRYRIKATAQREELVAIAGKVIAALTPSQSDNGEA